MASRLFSSLASGAKSPPPPPQQSTAVLTRMRRRRSRGGVDRFDYLLAVCERERLLLDKEEKEDKQEKKGCYNDDDDDDQYYLGEIDLNQSLITPSNHTVPDKEEWRKKLMGSFYGNLSWQNNVLKSVVQSTAQSNIPESVIPHSSGSDDSRDSLKRGLKYDEVVGKAVAEKVNNSKKRKRGSSRMPNNGPEPPPGLPAEFRNLILQLAGNRAVCVEKLVIQKELTKTDVNSTQNRLSIPARLVREEFLTEEEHLLLCQHNGKNVRSIEVPLITPMMEVAKASLRRWEMKKGKGVSSVSYVIANTWNAIRRRNKFESNDDSSIVGYSG
nr:B3 domain-containing protein At5g24050-like [Ipomoea batatas]